MGRITKEIYWNEEDQKDGLTFAHVHIKEGYGSQTLKHFLYLTKMLRETFPEAKDDDIHCGKITESRWCKGFTILAYSGYFKRDSIYEGWDHCSNGYDYYYS